MFREKFYCCFWTFTVLFSLSEGYWLSFLKLSTKLAEEESSDDRNNETEVYESFNENNSTAVGDLFWTTDSNITTDLTKLQDEENLTESTLMDVFENATISEKNDSAAAESIYPVEANDFAEEGINSEIKVPNTEFVASQMDQEIELSRTNCNMEIGIDEAQDTRILVKFGPIGSSVSGKCCITLNGEKGSVLGVFISDVHLLNDSSKEVLKVITNNFGTDFVLKQYNGRNEYQPLLLTETHKVYLVLYYNTTGEIKNDENTRFNLEVFSYRKHKSLKQEDNYNFYTPSGTKQNIENIYFTTEKPFENVPFYYTGFY